MNKYPEGTNVTCMQNDMDVLQEEIEGLYILLDSTVDSLDSVRYLLSEGWHKAALEELDKVLKQLKE